VHEKVLGVRQAQGLDEEVNFRNAKSRAEKSGFPFIFSENRELILLVSTLNGIAAENACKLFLIRRLIILRAL
jgi:hypothetical protein